MSTIPPEDLATLNALRELTNNENTDEILRQTELAKQRSAASARIIGHSKDKGWAVEQLDGTIVQNPNLHTTGALGKGQQVDLTLRQGTAAIDFKPLAVGDCGDFDSASATGTGTSSGSSSGGDSNTGQTNRHWRKDPSGFCYVVSYEGPQREGDHETERECLDALNLKNWVCLDGGCGTTLPGQGDYNSQEECEEARGPWGIVNGKCEILPTDQWCPAKGEKRFKSYLDCINSDIRYKCVNGECIRDITGQYVGLAECEAALIPAGFTGGQCVGVNYSVCASSSYQTDCKSVTGPILRLVPENTILGWSLNCYYGSATSPNVVAVVVGNPGDVFTNITVTRVDGQPDNCGDRKFCPS